jgi:hypothetical protein
MARDEGDVKIGDEKAKGSIRKQGERAKAERGIEQKQGRRNKGAWAAHPKGWAMAGLPGIEPGGHHRKYMAPAPTPHIAVAIYGTI